MLFSELAAHPALVRALVSKGFEAPTPVQVSVLAEELRGRDLLVSSATGSGKTVAFGLAMAPELLGDVEKAPRTRTPLALVVAPTRELAQQVQRELWWLYAEADMRTASCVGGTDIRREARALQDGAHIVVGTPGRLCDHLNRKTLDLSNVRAVVLDEADEMLDMGFREELEQILGAAAETRRTLLFSATIPPAIESLARSFQKDPLRVDATPGKKPHQDIEYRAHLIARRERDQAVVNVIRQTESPSTIVFCQTREGVNSLHIDLVERGFAAVALSGELTQAERNRGLQSLRDGRASVLVATDVAARGLDLPEVGLVVHADLPTNAETLQHRSGRTGRAGRKGVTVLLVTPEKRRLFERICRDAHVRAQWAPVPTPEDIRKLDEDRLVRDIEAMPVDTKPEDAAVAARLLASRTPEQLASMLVALHRAKLPEVAELPATTHAAQKNAQARDAKRAPRTDYTRDDSPGEPVRSGPPLASRGPRADDNQWFRLSVGREMNADPKWLVPLLCRRGAITKADIGAIRIGAEETLVEISARSAARFAVAVRRPDKADGSIQIRPAPPPAEPTWQPKPRRATSDGGFGRPFGERKPYGEGKPYGERKSYGERKPFGERKPYGASSRPAGAPGGKPPFKGPGRRGS